MTLEVTVDRHRPTPARNPRAPHLVYASDDTGDVVLTYFRAQPGYVEKLLPVGAKRYVSGTAQMYDGTLQITHPDRVVDEAGFAKLSGIDPVYPLTEGLALGSLRRAMAQALQKLPALPEWISPEVIRRCKFPADRRSAEPRACAGRADGYPARWSVLVAARLRRTAGRSTGAGAGARAVAPARRRPPCRRRPSAQQDHRRAALCADGLAARRPPPRSPRICASRSACCGCCRATSDRARPWWRCWRPPPSPRSASRPR